MKLRLRLRTDESGAAAVEMAFAIPIFVVMIWAFVQLAEVYRAVAGMQQALGEGARYATLCEARVRQAVPRRLRGLAARRLPVL